MLVHVTVTIDVEWLQILIVHKTIIDYLQLHTHTHTLYSPSNTIVPWQDKNIEQHKNVHKKVCDSK